MSRELPDVQAEGRETRHQIANIRWIIEKSKEFHKKKTKTSTSTLLTYAKAFDCVNHNKLWKIV